jgi:hypothetical protein
MGLSGFKFPLNQSIASQDPHSLLQQCIAWGILEASQTLSSAGDAREM